MSEREAVEQFFAERGLAYTAEKGYEAHQVYSAIRDAMHMNKCCVMARVRTNIADYFCWGYYDGDDAVDVAVKVKRVRTYYVMDVTIFGSDS